MKAELVLGNLKREREALNGKLERLEATLNKEWQDEDQEYLCTQQYNAMSLYAHILDERICDIEMKLEERKLASKDPISHETSHCCDKIFKSEINTEACKEYTNTFCCNSNHCEDDDPVVIIVKMIQDTFGDDII
jgi:hypothetical protein